MQLQVRQKTAAQLLYGCFGFVGCHRIDSLMRLALALVLLLLVLFSMVLWRIAHRQMDDLTSGIVGNGD